MRTHNALVLTLAFAASLILTACTQSTPPENTVAAATGITINALPESGIITLPVGSSTNLTATVEGDEGVSQEVIWSSDAPEYATITSSGNLSGLQPTAEPAVITAASKTQPDISSSAQVQILAREPEAPVTITNIVVSSDAAHCCLGTAPRTLGVGQDTRFTAHVSVNHGSLPEEASTRWVSSDPGALTVQDDGTATALAPGKVMVTATISTPAQPEGVTGALRLEVTPVLRGRIANHNPAEETMIRFGVRAHPEEGSAGTYLNASTASLNDSGEFELVMPSVPERECSNTPEDCFGYEMFFWTGHSDSQANELRGLIVEPGRNELGFGWVYAFADVTIVDPNWPLPFDIGFRDTVSIDASLKAGWNPIAVTGNYFSPKVETSEQPASLTLIDYPN